MSKNKQHLYIYPKFLLHLTKDVQCKGGKHDPFSSPCHDFHVTLEPWILIGFKAEGDTLLPDRAPPR